MKIEIEYEGVKLISENKILVITAPDVFEFCRIQKIANYSHKEKYPIGTFQDIINFMNSTGVGRDVNTVRKSGIDQLYILLEDFRCDNIYLYTPETNLHPLEIVKLAKIIILLSKKPEINKIIITTHSDYLLEAMNSLIKYEFKVDQWHKEGNKPFEMCDTSDGFQSGQMTKCFYDILKGDIL